MTGLPRSPQDSRGRTRRVLGFAGLGAVFGGSCGALTGCVFGIMSGLDLIDGVAGGMMGGFLGGTSAMTFVGMLGGRKCRQLDQMKSAAFSGAFGTILGGMAGIAILDLLETLTGRHAGIVSQVGDDLVIILVAASAAGSVVTWSISHLSRREKPLQYVVLAMFLAGVGCVFVTPATIPFGIGGAVAGFSHSECSWPNSDEH